MYALKEADVGAMSALERKDAVNEIRLMASIRHENIVKYHEAILDGRLQPFYLLYRSYLISTDPFVAFVPSAAFPCLHLHEQKSLTLSLICAEARLVIVME